MESFGHKGLRLLLDILEKLVEKYKYANNFQYMYICVSTYNSNSDIFYVNTVNKSCKEESTQRHTVSKGLEYTGRHTNN